jgi:hypothetical protein
MPQPIDLGFSDVLQFETQDEIGVELPERACRDSEEPEIITRRVPTMAFGDV